jgi:5-methylcytosine-specific restriction enzyme A
MTLIYHWQSQNYYRDAKFGFGYHLNQGNQLMMSLKEGDSLWAFTRNKSKLYVMAAELIVRACTHNPPKYRYGAYRVWADIQHSRYFDVDNSPNIEPLIRTLSVQSNADILGRSFQGHAAVRKLTESDHQILVEFTRNLPVLEQVSFYPEDEVEAKLIHADLEEIDSFIKIQDFSREASRKKYLYESLNITRSQKLSHQVRDLYKGKCQVCGFDPLREYGFHLCHAHHIVWLSRGGEDEMENLSLVCPNHHNAFHTGDAIFDFEMLTFTYKNGYSERLILNEHLAA